jgi:radical SAM enzyme (TIGR01210 family)
MGEPGRQIPVELTPSMYPADLAARDRFVLERRGPRRRHDPWRYQDLVVEDERTAQGTVARVATVFLTGRECPWRCVMCDLWRFTIPDDTPIGAIPMQLAAAHQALAPFPLVRHIKLYNAGSFFDPRAVPIADYGAVAAQLAGFERVVVECHPNLIGPRVDTFLDTLHAGSGPASPPALEVAMGLETAHPDALARLHKRMTVEDFDRAAAELARRGAALRVFLLIAVPFVPPNDQVRWLMHSLDLALSSGATVVSLIPTRSGNGAVEALAKEGCFQQPTLADIEESFQAALVHAAGRGRVFIDLWDLERFARCPNCFHQRRARLHAMNLSQRPLDLVTCDHCNRKWGQTFSSNERIDPSRF